VKQAMALGLGHAFAQFVEILGKIADRFCCDFRDFDRHSSVLLIVLDCDMVRAHTSYATGEPAHGAIAA
jgi:hypothetical protein